MAATTMSSLPPHEVPGDTTLDKHDSISDPVLPPQVHTPPTTDEASHKDDDAASSSSLSDLGDDMEDEENRMRFEEAARAGAEAEQFSEVKPDRYENGVPIFTPVRQSPHLRPHFRAKVAETLTWSFVDDGTIQGFSKIRQGCESLWNAVWHCLDRSPRRMVRLGTLHVPQACCGLFSPLLLERRV